jgi:hypothetical protein
VTPPLFSLTTVTALLGTTAGGRDLFAPAGWAGQRRRWRGFGTQ